jgi:3-methyl-2-oxobutanoate hydroxymethyltransferase
MSRITVTDLQKKKAEGKKITMLTAYDFPFAAFVDKAGIDMILVGDSLGVVVQGKENTLPVTMDEMLYHTEMVCRGSQQTLVVGDMPFMSYQSSRRDAIINAGRFIKESGAQAVKLEGGAQVRETIEAIAGADIPVMAHIGLTPQSVHKMGGYKVQKEMERLVNDAQAVEKAGAFAVVLECVPGDVAKRITAEISIPTIGIGAGVHCDGQVLVLHDLLGLFERFVPKFIKRYANLGETVVAAIREYREEVEAGVFPGEEHTFR